MNFQAKFFTEVVNSFYEHPYYLVYKGVLKNMLPYWSMFNTEF